MSPTSKTLAGTGTPAAPGRGLRSALGRLLRDRRGTSYIIVALISVPLMGMIGLSADGGRAYLVKARLSTSVDAAALAGAKNAWNGAYGNDVTKYFNSNFPPGFLGATPVGPTFTKTTNEQGYDVIRVHAAATMPTAFMHLFGFETITVSAESEATRKTVAMDLVLSMDMSGSMGSWVNGKKKIASAREAAKELVNILYGQDETNTLLKIGLVPWSGNVNILLDATSTKPVNEWDPSQTTQKFVTAFTNPVDGTTQDHVWQVNNSPVRLLFKPDSGWKGCVFARYSNDGNSANDADDALGYLDAQGWKGWEPRIYNGKTCGWGCTTCPKRGITPLNQSKSQTLAALDRLTEPTGNTDIPQGLSWAWRVLMNTAPFTEGTADTPDKQLIRAVVLLTDGANCAADGDGYKAVWGGCYWYSTQKMDERAILIANKMKAQGILIYTIQFGFNDADAATTLKAIASGTGAPYYSYAPDSAALQKIFQQIGNSLSELRLSK